MEEKLPLTLGWREYVDLPDWKASGILAKIDTGARTSALHVSHIEEISEGTIRFEIVLSLKDPNRRIVVACPYERTTLVKPSSGKVQKRFVVATTMRIGSIDKHIEVSLASRKNMYCRMLIGRTALEDKFLVDASRKFIFGKPTFKHMKKGLPR